MTSFPTPSPGMTAIFIRSANLAGLRGAFKLNRSPSPRRHGGPEKTTRTGFLLCASAPLREILSLQSERCFKRVGRMPDLRLAAFGPNNRHHIKPGRRLGRAVAGKVELGGLCQLMPL